MLIEEVFNQKPVLLETTCSLNRLFLKEYKHAGKC